MMKQNESTVLKNGVPMQAQKEVTIKNFVNRAMREGIIGALPYVRKRKLERLKVQRAIRDKELLAKRLENIMDSAICDKMEEVRSGDFRGKPIHLSGTAVKIDCDLREATFIINKPLNAESPVTYLRTEYKVSLDGTVREIGSSYSEPRYRGAFEKWGGLYKVV